MELKRSPFRFTSFVTALLVCTIVIGTVFVVTSPSCAAAAENLVPNASLENGADKPAYWEGNSWGDNDAILTYPVPGVVSAKAAKIEIKRYASGDAKWYFVDVPVTGNTTYYFSEYFQSNATTQVIAKYQHKDGTTSYQDLDTLLPSVRWRPYSTFVTAPDSALTMSIFHVLHSVGVLMVDEYMLMPAGTGPVPSSFDKGYVSLTFDDGWESQFAYARPVLEAKRIPASFFIITNKITDPISARETIEPDVRSNEDHAHYGEKQILTSGFGSLIRRGAGVVFGCKFDSVQRYMTEHQILRLKSDGHEISSHTKDHARLAAVDSETAKEEITESRKVLKEVGFEPADTFVYPYGSYNGEVMNLVYSAGYIGARSVEPGYNTVTSNRYALKVKNISASTTLEEVKSWIDTARQQKLWLNLVFHQVDRSGGEYSVTPELIAEIVDYIEASRITPITMHDGLTKMK